jgi:hypothetical protein
MAIVNGRVGINCNIPAYTLDVAGDINYTGNLKINGANAVFTPAGINSVGNVGINGALNTNYALTVNGAQSITGTLGVANDITTGRGVFATTEISLGVAAQGFLRFTTLNAASFIQSYNNSGVFQSILFTGATGTSEQMILTATGLGIGTTTPAYKLDVNGTTNLNGEVTFANDENIRSKLDNVRRLYFQNTATTYFGSGNGFYAFQDITQQVFTFTIDNAGNVVAKGNVTAYSDVRAKENITTIDSAVDKVMALRGVYYTRKDNPGPRQVGVIAQEVETILPEVVMTDTEGKKSVAYGNIVALLIEAMKEQQEMIKELKSTIGAYCI